MILVTGANGFVGSALIQEMAIRGLPVRAASRTKPRELPAGFVWIPVEDLGVVNHWRNILCDVEGVIHCAARVHVMNERSSDPMTEFRRINVEGTLNLARQAANAGVRRFIFLSSVKVNGEMTLSGTAFRADDKPIPEDAYGISKYEAELGLRELSAQTGMEVVIIRPPLVYGPGVKANFASMMRWLASGIPLPFGSVTTNRRSLVAVDNLVDLILVCLSHPAAANQTFMVSDGEDLSTTALLIRMGQAMGRSTRLLPFPPSLLAWGGRVLGKEAVVQRLLGNLQVDIGKTQETLGWRPPVTVDEGLKRAAARTTV